MRDRGGRGDGEGGREGGRGREGDKVTRRGGGGGRIEWNSSRG